MSNTKPILKLLLWSLTIASIIVALANPQIGSKLEEAKREGIDIVVALDLSNSMLAEDLAPNRLENAKRAISKLIDQLKSDRLGIVVFAGQAFTQLPITTDYAAAKLFLNTINTDILPVQGTAIGEAIDLAMESFNFENATSKVIVVITDGENHEDDALGAVKRATEKDVIVHTIGMGSIQGSPIPVYNGRNKAGYRKDKAGSTVVTKLNEPMLRELANAGNGIYVRATNSNTGLDLVVKEMNKLEKATFGTKIFSDYEDRFQYFVALAMFFMILNTLVLERKNRWFNAENLFGIK